MCEVCTARPQRCAVEPVLYRLSSLSRHRLVLKRPTPQILTNSSTPRSLSRVLANSVAGQPHNATICEAKRLEAIPSQPAARMASPTPRRNPAVIIIRQLRGAFCGKYGSPCFRRQLEWRRYRSELLCDESKTMTVCRTGPLRRGPHQHSRELWLPISEVPRRNPCPNRRFPRTQGRIGATPLEPMHFEAAVRCWWLRSEGEYRWPVSDVV